MSRPQAGFTLIELMIVVVIIGLLASIALPAFHGMANRARVAEVKQNMFVVQLTIEDFATRNNGTYPPNAAATTSDGGLTFAQLLPGIGSLPRNPFTMAPTTVDWSNAFGTRPTTDAAGGIALNVVQTILNGAYDAYEVRGEDAEGSQLSLVLTNQ
jgi:prepilin-type N-terminal cleavage/methylation domain-containing protein